MDLDSVSISECSNGVTIVKLSSWKMFHSFIMNSIPDNKKYIFRGQRDSSWKLEPSFDRLAHKCGKNLSKEILKEQLKEHLSNFQNSKRGRRSHNAEGFGEDGLWALGQHYGLATPLLDWTESPFIAAYFAFFKKNSGDNNERVVYALDKNLINYIDSYKDPYEKKYPPHVIVFEHFPTMKILGTHLDEDPRIIAQRGVFVRCPIGVDIETYVNTRFEGVNETVLMKVLIPENGNDREMFLKHLNKMNISHLTLFPDLQGASIYSNMIIEIDNY